MRKASSAGVLLNPVKLLDFINSSLSSVTIDAGLSQGDLVTLAKELRSLSTSKVRTLTIPLGNADYNPGGIGSTVLWDPVLAPQLFDRIKNDEPLIDMVKANPSASPSAVDNFKTGSAADDPCAPKQ